MSIEDAVEVPQSRTRFFIIHNPNSGSAARQLFRETLSFLKDLGASVETFDTARHGEGMKASVEATKSGGFDAIVAAGGDGTVHDVAEGLVGQSIPLGIIPMGTGNVLSQEIGLQRSAHELANTLVRGKVHDIPVGQVNGRPFLFVVGIGFDAEAVRVFEREGTREYGQMGFVWPVLRALGTYKDKPLHIVTEKSEREAQWIIVTRVKRYAGNLMLTPSADLHDTRFHLLCIKSRGPLTRVRQLAALALGVIDRDPTVHIESVTRIRIDGDRGVPVQVDGEVLCELPLEINFHPARIRIIFPRT